MTEAEKEAKLKVFEKLKIHPKEKEENQYLIAKGRLSMCSRQALCAMLSGSGLDILQVF